jgi:D-proline reductase (dithiol) PrdB
MRFPFGHALGEVGKGDQQINILFRAFTLLFEAEKPGMIVDSGLRWKREDYPAPDWEAFKRLEPRKR